MVSPGRQAGLVLALSTLAVVGAIPVLRPMHAAPATEVAGAVSLPASRKVERATRTLQFPVRGGDPAQLRDTYDERRGVRRHHALDIMAPRGTPVVAVADGTVAKLFRNPLGGITLYQFDANLDYVYYYAHLDKYAAGIHEGMALRRGEVLGYVGSTGNAPEHAPHLHFAMFALGDDKRWWKGAAVNPYPLLKAD
jgi:murein DD-endopeptidase MepM/ murein hydrolase activator NlpD